ncbi:putative transposase/invertase (TIGR01784 family) [Lactobacillus colini]|uniref:Transposase/invertase (TIGR01784 family) n=1 Tax=Lactobacillus colini TaxID=1819254 RepID=A0ABS4MEX8_9LACO|nr:Rpn family recombination-promoting nuclease/putative transposase [Lactobacillus colini]MBP2058242.1 putative transposase/invertase (TIGR01784 family) [Lactobacillus colini]
MLRRSYLAGDFKQDLTLDPIFGYVMSKKENCLHLLQMALPELDIQEIVDISPQKPIDLNLFEKTSRLDVYAKDKQERVYDIEMQNLPVDFLTRRAWYYLRQLNIPKPGENYDHVKASYVIFFCMFDPFNEDRAAYRFDFTEQRNHNLTIENVGHLLFFNAKGKDRNNITPQMAEFLDYLNGQVSKKPSKYIIQLNDDIKEYTSKSEWGEIMNQIALMRENIQEDDRREAVSKMIELCREDFNLDDNKILSLLTKRYGDDFTKDQLQEMIEQTK